MKQIMFVLAGILLFAVAGYAQSPITKKADPHPEDRQCCYCCAAYGTCNCMYCSVCPTVRTGKEKELSNVQIDQLESLGIRIQRSFSPLRAGTSSNCPKLEGLLKQAPSN